MKLAVAITLALTTAVEADIRKCNMQLGRNIQYGWIAPEIYVFFDEATKKIEVFDGIVSEFNKEKPIEAKLGIEKPNSRTFRWALLVINGAGQRTKMQYQASLFLDTNKLHVTAKPNGYSDFLTATGTCQPYKG